MLRVQTNEGDIMSTAAGRNRKRDNAERLGKLQTGLNLWLDTTPGQYTLIMVGIGMMLVAASLGR